MDKNCVTVNYRIFLELCVYTLNSRAIDTKPHSFSYIQNPITEFSKALTKFHETIKEKIQLLIPNVIANMSQLIGLLWNDVHYLHSKPID